MRKSFLLRSFLKNLKSRKIIITTNRNASTGRKIETTDINVLETVSAVATTGFARPAVVSVEPNRRAEVFPAITAAVPPPAIIARAQVTTGPKSATVATIMQVPAIVAKGIVIVSKTLSNHGMK